jgi:hypothetical protein
VGIAHDCEEHQQEPAHNPTKLATEEEKPTRTRGSPHNGRGVQPHASYTWYAYLGERLQGHDVGGMAPCGAKVEGQQEQHKHDPTHNSRIALLAARLVLSLRIVVRIQHRRHAVRQLDRHGRKCTNLPHTNNQVFKSNRFVSGHVRYCCCTFLHPFAVCARPFLRSFI